MNTRTSSVALACLLIFGNTFIFPGHAASSSAALKFDHIVTMVLENVGLADICGFSYPCDGRTVAPYMASLANNNSLSLHYATAKSPPTVTNSLPNYLALTSGQTFSSWSNSDCNPSATCSTNATNIVDRLEAAGLNWKAFAEDYPVSSGCYRGPDTSLFSSRHLPFNYYSDVSGSRCNDLSNAGAGLADTSFMNYLNSSGQANYIWLAPNRCDDGHDQCSQIGSIATSCGASPSGGFLCQQEAYLKQIVPKILATSMFTSQRSVLLITYDEGSNYCPATGRAPDCVYSVLVGAGVKTHYSSTSAYSHYSALATVENNWGLACISSECSASPMTEFFNPTLVVNQVGIFQGEAFSTAGWLAYNSTHVINGALTINVTSGSALLATRTYSLKAQHAGASGAARYILSGHVTDGGGVELSAYLYASIASGTVAAYFVARSAAISQGPRINIQDVGFINLRFGTCLGDPRYDARADLDASGCVNINSIGIVMINYGSPVYT